MDIPEVYTTGIDNMRVSCLRPSSFLRRIIPNSTVRKLNHEDPEP
jgi:hypothetical protein